MGSMTTASISELKANLSRYVNEVRRGGEVQVLDRGMPVARLVPAAPGNDPKALDRLVSRGLIRPGKGDPAAVLKEPPLELPVSILDALLEDRDDQL
jgi:prevent-host-death family protein